MVEKSRYQRREGEEDSAGEGKENISVLQLDKYRGAGCYSCPFSLPLFPLSILASYFTAASALPRHLNFS